MESSAGIGTKIVVFDLEWNMASPHETVAPEVRTAIPYEIIEIGAIRLNSQGQYEQTFNALVRPVVYPKLNPFVARVTNRAKESIRYGLPFKAAYSNFAEFCGTDYIFATWSDSDALPLKQNMAWHDLGDHLGVRVVDVQRAFTRIFEAGAPQRSIEYALDFLKLPKDQPFHQAVSDAWYTGKVLTSLLKHWEGDIASFVTAFSYNPDIRLSLQDRLEPQESQAAMEQELLRYEVHCPACDRLLTAVSEPVELADDEEPYDRADPATRKPEKTWQDEGEAGQTAMAKALAAAMQVSGQADEVKDLPSGSTAEAAAEPAEQKPVKAPHTVGPWRGYGKKLRAVWSCPEHDLISGHVRLRRGKNKVWYATVTLRLVKS